MRSRILFVCLGLCGFGPLGADEVELTYEIFSMPLSDAATLMREKPGGEESYRRILKGMEEKGWRQEHLMILKAVEGTKVFLEEVEEVDLAGLPDGPGRQLRKSLDLQARSGRLVGDE